MRMDPTINPFWKNRLRTVKNYGMQPDEVSEKETEEAKKALQAYGLLETFETEAGVLQFPLNVASAQNFYYSRLTLQFIERCAIQTPARFLEIGGGGGLLAAFLFNAGAVSRYEFVDLAEMLQIAVQTMVKIGTENQCGLHVTEQIERIENASIDIALNFNSFMEMDREVRDYYFEQVYRVCRPGALFINSNRMSRNMLMRDGSTYENNPLLYSYRPSDEIIHWEPDHFQQDRKARHFRSNKDSFAICRVSRVNL